MSRYIIVFLLFLLPFCSRSQTCDDLYSKFMNEFSAQNYPAAIGTGKIYLNKVVVKDLLTLNFYDISSFVITARAIIPLPLKNTTIPVA